MKCKKCGNLLPYGARICPNCGADDLPKGPEVETEIYSESKIFHPDEYKFKKSNQWTLTSVIVGVIALLFSAVAHVQIVFIILGGLLAIIGIICASIGMKKKGKSNPFGMILSLVSLLICSVLFYFDVMIGPAPFITGTWTDGNGAIHTFERDGNYYFQSENGSETKEGSYQRKSVTEQDDTVTVRVDQTVMNGVTFNETVIMSYEFHYNEESNRAEVTLKQATSTWKKEE